jgi:hypothetical protein
MVLTRMLHRVTCQQIIEIVKGFVYLIHPVRQLPDRVLSHHVHSSAKQISGNNFA